jgi:small conductance mechanosensitive channel
MDWNSVVTFLQQKAASVGLEILGALALYVIGRWLISLVVSAVQRVMSRQDIEPTVLRFAANTLSVVLNITLVVAILGYFGVQTTTFAALIAAAGLAIGTAWAGLLSNFAAGAFLLVLRPFKVGDFIAAGGVTGTVNEIGLFVTTFDTPDNVKTYVGNSKIFADTKTFR